jgi:hypothetical protein
LNNLVAPLAVSSENLDITRLLVEAERRGHRIQNGIPMMETQIGMIAEFFGLSVVA